MGVAKVILNDEVLIDVTAKTVTDDKMLYGITALKKDGEDAVGSIASKSSSDLTVSGKTVTAPSGFYASNASASVADGSATTPATTITSTPTISVNSSGLITASNSKTQSVTPTVSAGYVSSGTAGTITVSGSNTSQLSTVGATTYNTSSSDQSIASGKYLTGKQTIKAVITSGIEAENIKYGVTVKFGDANSATRIKNVSGAFTDASTVSTGQTATTASQMLSGYSAWVDGEEVKGNIATKTSSDLTASGKTVTVPVGYYATQATKDVATGSVTMNTPTVNASTGVVTATATVTAGYVTASSPSKTLTLTTATATVTGTNSVSITASATGTNALISEDDNGVAITVSSSASASVTATATTGTAGFAKTSASLGSATLTGSNTDSSTFYISGVTIVAPSSGEDPRTFSITVPNGNSTATFLFSVDSSGNVVVTES